MCDKVTQGSHLRGATVNWDGIVTYAYASAGCCVRNTSSLESIKQIQAGYVRYKQEYNIKAMSCMSDGLMGSPSIAGRKQGVDKFQVTTEQLVNMAYHKYPLRD